MSDIPNPLTLEWIVKEHDKLIWYLVHYYKNVIAGSYWDLDDLYQMILIQIFKNLENFDPNKGKLSTWIGFQARAAAYIGKQRQYRTIGDYELNTDYQYGAEQDFDSLDDLLLDLPLDWEDKIVIWAKLYGYEADEIAKALGVVTETVYARSARIRSKLRGQNDDESTDSDRGK